MYLDCKSRKKSVTLIIDYTKLGVALMLDVDQLHTNLVKTLDKFGGTFHVDYLNYNFDRDDLEKIFSYLRGEL